MDARQYSLHRFFAALVALVVLLGVGTVGYRWLEGMEPADALYMTVITISTVGFGEIKPLSQLGRLFTIGLIVSGALIAVYGLSTATEFVLSGEWREHLAKERRRKMLAQLRNHIIVCGYGRVGRQVVHELQAECLPFVVIDPDPATVTHLQGLGHFVMQGNAADEATLREAGIEHARGLIAAVNADAENVFIVLTARGINPHLHIVARANYEASESKLLRAGANRVISPYRMAGRRMVTMIARPDVADFLDEVSHIGSEELVLEQITISPACKLVGQTLADAQLKERIGVTLLACRMPGSPTRITPTGSTKIQAHMQMLALGSREQTQTLLRLARGE